ncbi:MAG: sigma-54 dependent transcriptional regulator [Ahrensia sp.]|nr:sigma-54 dependent transcriptional regulator [Ahrensia sp.]
MTQSSADILIVEDAISIALTYESWLKRAGLSSLHAATGEEALNQLRNGTFKAVLLDLQLPDIDGFEIMSVIRAEDIPVTVVVVTSTGSIKTAVDVMKAGAYDYVVKPAAQERLLTTVRNAMEREKLQSAVKEITRPYQRANVGGFIGSSLPMIAVYKMIEAVGRSNASVFVTGESGTGKEVCAQAIHLSSARKDKPFVALNCAAIPKDLMESEIFGHLKGAFTGATSSREGAAMAANGGTLFLDEICEMDLALQSKLLRFLQTGTVQKVGSDKVEKVDVRIVCATNRDPQEEVERGRFREDLFYRLHVVSIELPPLRERDNDVVEIAKSLLTQISPEEGKDFEEFSADAEAALKAHHWPGNVRELQNTIRKAVILNEGSTLTAEMLSFGPRGATAGCFAQIQSAPETDGDPQITLQIGQPYDAMERHLIEATIAHCDGSIPRAAELLQLSPSTVYRKKESWAGV